MTNVAKHAHASRVDVLLEARDGSIILVIEDDGVGFDAENTSDRERGIGLLGMRERAGLISAEFELESASGDGTSIFVRYSPSANEAEGTLETEPDSQSGTKPAYGRVEPGMELSTDQ